MSVVLVGELNPYGSDPRYALYCEPPNSAGGRMQRLVCGLHERTYVGQLARMNLCVGKWSMKAARESAWNILTGRHKVVVMLGRKVADAFRGGGAAVEPFCWSEEAPGQLLVSLPHPSGLCRAWNEPGAFLRARALLREVAPEVPWGELDG